MKGLFLRSCAVITLAALCATTAVAHHSAAMFDMTKTIIVEGTVQDFQWTNPHSWLLVVGDGPKGSDTVWSFEAGPPSMLTRIGLKKADFRAGDKVKVHAYPVKDNQPLALLMSVDKADGTNVDFSVFK